MADETKVAEELTTMVDENETPTEFLIGESSEDSVSIAEGSNAVRKLDFTMEDKSEHECKLCNEKVESVEALLYHYCFHFEDELKSSAIFDGKTCLKCNRTFEAQDSVFILHFGLFHANIIDILKEKGIGKFEVSRPDIETEKPEEEFEEDPNIRLDKHTCQVCKKEGSRSRILMCYCLHFMKDVRVIVDPLLEGLRCKLCNSAFTNKTNAVKHIGTTHGKVNILLKEKGIPEIQTQNYRQRKPKPHETDTHNGEIELKKMEAVVLDDNDDDMVLVDKLLKSTEFLINSDPERFIENTLAELFDERGTISPSPTPSIVSSNSSETECEICGKDVRLRGKLWQHYHGHLAFKVKKKFADLMLISDESYTCKICGSDSKTEMSLLSHISLTHQKLNEVLIERGIKPLTKRLIKKTSEEAAM